MTVELAPVEPWDIGAPTIQVPTITGASAGKPIIFAIPVTGERPITFQAQGLPTGLTLDAGTGILTGVTRSEGDHRIFITARNAHGKSERELTLAIGRGLALTPPMGWNSWNAWRRWVSDKHIRAAADALVRTGLAARGYNCVNIDSCWQGQRGGKFNAIQPNVKFPDMHALSAYIHQHGLKFGIYSTPWVEPWGCSAAEAKADWGGDALIGCSSGEQDPSYPRHQSQLAGKYVGIHKHEPQDVAQFVDWQVDFLKYDWAPTDDRCLERMGRCLENAPRDIIFSVCTDAKVMWADAYLRWCHMWRSIPDTADNWRSLQINGLCMDDYHGCEDWRAIVRPGRWNDLDMLALGPQFHSANSSAPNQLTPAEQVMHMTLWAIYPSPLILSCDLDAINDFELRLFGNEEVIAVNQDPLGKVATRVREERTRQLVPGARLRNYRIHAKPLSNGDIAVAVINIADDDDTIAVTAADLGLSRNFSVRDLWRRRDLGRHCDQITIDVPAHGAAMLRLRHV